MTTKTGKFAAGTLEEAILNAQANLRPTVKGGLYGQASVRPVDSGGWKYIVAVQVSAYKNAPEDNHRNGPITTAKVAKAVAK